MTEKYRSLDQTIESKEKRVSKKAKLGAFLGGGALLLTACSTETPVDYGEPDTEVTSVTLQDEARIRGTPQVGNEAETSNLLYQVDLRDLATEIDIPTPSGVYESEDSANGDWIGISVNDLPTELQEKLNDKDGIVWINEKMAAENTSADQLQTTS